LWDQAEIRYKERLKQIRGELPSVVKLLANKLCLHDAEVVNLAASESEALILARQQNLLYMLAYRLTAPASIGAARCSPAFSEHAVRWLYDEVDLAGQGAFSHEILLSNGQEIRLLFDDVRIESFEIHPLGTSQKLKLTDSVLAQGQELTKTILKPTGKRSAPNLVAKARELGLAIRDARRPSPSTGQQFAWFSTGTKAGQVTTVTVFGLRSAKRKDGARASRESVAGRPRRKARRNE
jgi:hypothetical protein